jgi:nitrate/nitrite-specific signal transduction histidine kinase
MFKDEIDILYAASNKLTKASAPDELLDAISDYPQSKGAECGILFYLENTDPDYAEWTQIVAEWAYGEVAPLGLGTRLRSFLAQMLRDDPALRGMPLFIEDGRESPIIPRENREVGLEHSILSAVLLPLYANGRVHGSVMFGWSQPRVFDEQDRRIYTALLQQAAPVADSARLYEQAQRRAEELEQAKNELNLLSEENRRRAARAEYLLTIYNALTQATDEQEILAAIARHADAQEADSLVLRYFDSDANNNPIEARNVAVWKRGAFYEGMANSEQNLQFSLADYPASRIFLEHPDAPLFIENAWEDPRMIPYGTANIKFGHMALVLLPLYAAGRWQGILLVRWKNPRTFDTEEREIYRGLVQIVSSVVATRRAYLAAQALAANEERTRLARELHDSVSQALFGIALGARTARNLFDTSPEKLGEPLDYILSLAEAGLTEMRALIFELRPETLENEGLITALSKQAASLQTRHGLKMHVDLCDEPQVPLGLKEAVYRIAREALHNTVKHAHATEVSLKIQTTLFSILLEIADNGIGFDPEQAFPGHLGLKSMRERVQRLKGDFDIKSAPGQGTRINVRIPKV